MMESKYIEKIFSDYLSAKKTNYAILINGSWGSGKTYFWKNKLSKSCKEANLKPIYLSLNGLNKIETLDYQLKVKLIPYLNKLRPKRAKAITRVSKNILNKLAEKYGNFNPNDILKDVEIDLNLFSNNVVCFDDLERCKIPLSEVFGYVNDFVEHKNLKVIFLSDELKNKDESYKAIKEKVIGRTLYFKNNLSETFPLFVENYKNIDDDFYGFLQTKKPFIIDLLIEYSEENLRNVTFYLDVLSRLYNTIKSHSDYIDEVLLFALIITVEFKTGRLNSNDFENYKGYNEIDANFISLNFSGPEIDSRSKEEKTKSDSEIFYERYLSENIDKYFFYASIYQFVLTGYLDKEKLSDELKSRYPVQLKKEILVFNKLLCYEFRDLRNDEFTRLFKEVYQFAKEGKYTIYDYVRISDFFNFFSKNKLISNSIDDIRKTLTEGINIAKERGQANQSLFDSLFRMRRRNEGDEVIINLVTSVHNSIMKKNEVKKVNKLISAISDNNSELMEEVFQEYQFRKELFDFLTPELLFEALLLMNNKTFVKFYFQMKGRYKSINIKEYLKEDYKFLITLNSMIVDRLEGKENYQVQEFLFKELSDIIGEICQKLK